MADPTAQAVAEIASLTTAIERSGGGADAAGLYFDRASKYDEVGDYGRAVSDYLAALDRTTDRRFSARIKAMVALTFAKVSDGGEKAVFWALGAVDRDPDDPLAHYVLGLVCSFNDLDDVAANALRKALELDPENAEAKLKLGECLGELGRSGESIRVLSEYVAEHPTDASGWYQLGRSQVCSFPIGGQYADAVRSYGRALRESPHPNLRSMIERSFRDLATVFDVDGVADELRP